MDRVIVDTSSIVLGFENGKSVFEAIIGQLEARSVLVSKGIINELGIISERKSSKGRSARAALKEIEAKRIRIDAASGYPDNWIRKQAAEGHGTTVVTNDTALAKSLPEGTRILKFSKDGRLRPFVR